MKSNFLKKNRLLLLMVLVAVLPIIGFAQSKSITGNVVDDTGNLIPGVTVRVAGTTVGSITDLDGKYSIKAAPKNVLVFSFIGMKTQEVTIGTNTVVNITMKSDVSNLDEVVVVGYGVQTKESVVGAISQISGEKLQTMKMGGSIENTLQGSLPGLTVIQTDATPGEESLSGLKMLIRGSSSLGNNNPLVIVDGVERSFSNFDPNEIASISVLKDASATAVYGVKGANGVIIVTTKRGRTGAVQLEFTSEISMKEATRLPEYLNSYETLLMRNEAYKNDQQWDKLYSNEELEHYRTQDLPYVYPDFDWMEFLFKPAIDQNYNLNARGGNDFVQYFVSLGYLHEGDIFTVGNLFPYNYDKHNAHYFHNRYNFRNNLDFNLTKTTKLSVNLGGNIKQWGKPFDDYTQETWFEPVTLMPYYPEEMVNQFPDNVIPYDQDGIRFACNPDMGNVRLDWMGARGFDRKKSNELNADITLEQNLDFITKGLSVTGSYSYNSYVRYVENFRTGSGFYGMIYGYYFNGADSTWTRYDSDGKKDMDTPQPKLQSLGDNMQESFNSHYFKINANYARTFGNHNVSALGLFSRRQSQGDYPNDPPEFPHYEENWVGRGTYDYKQKYFVEGSLALSGSEKFAPGLRFGLFPAVAAGWMVSNEQFFKDAMPWANLFKIRYSLGKVGSDAGIARWLYTSEYTSNSYGASFGYPYTNYPTIGEGNIPVTDATWEEAIKQNLGFEMGFFQNMITVNVDLYNERRENILQDRMRVPTWLGAGTIQANIGSTKSHGFEVEFGFNKTLSNDWNIFATANVSANESRVVYYDEPKTKAFNLTVEGKPVEIASGIDSYTPTSGVVVEGYYQNIDELFMAAKASGVAAQSGDHLYLDFNGDGNIDAQDYIVAQHPYAPAITWNTKIGVNYKKWNARVDFYGISDVQYQMRQGGMFYLYPFSQNKNNALSGHANYWTPENTNASYPTVHYNPEVSNPNYRFSSFSNVDGKYVRLKNIRVGYQFKSEALKTVGVSNVELALTGTNLFTWTEYPLGGDPEGANSGADFGAYPQLRRYTLELKIVF